MIDIKLIAGGIIALILGGLYLLSKNKQPDAVGPGGTAPTTTTPAKTTTPVLGGQAYCDAKYPGSTYNATRNTCVKPASATTPGTAPAGTAIRQADSFNTWYAAFLAVNNINPATVNAMDTTPDGAQIQVMFMDGSRKWYNNPQAIPLSTVTPKTAQCKSQVPWERPYTDLHRDELGILMDEYGVHYVAAYNTFVKDNVTHYVVEDNPATNTAYYSLPDTCPTPAVPVPVTPPTPPQPYIPPNPVNTVIPAAPMANKDCEVEATNTSPAVGPAGGPKGSPEYWARIAWCRQAGGYN